MSNNKKILILSEKRKKEKGLLKVQENQCVMGENKGKEGALRINVDLSYAGKGKIPFTERGGGSFADPK